MKRETRTKKYRNKRSKLKAMSIIKALIKDVYYLLVALVYLVLKTYVELEKAFIKVFRMLPIWVKRVIILTLIINVVILSNKDAEVVEKIKEVQELKEVYVVKESFKEEKEKCTYGLYECAIYDEALEQGLNVEQSKIAIAISKWETGSYTSNLFKNSNNLGGLYDSVNRRFYKYDSVEEGIESYVRNLKVGYFDKGLDTIEEIQKKYCPVGAENDPLNLNSNWLSGVKYFYEML